MKYLLSFDLFAVLHFFTPVIDCIITPDCASRSTPPPCVHPWLIELLIYLFLLFFYFKSIYATFKRRFFWRSVQDLRKCFACWRGLEDGIFKWWFICFFHWFFPTKPLTRNSDILSDFIRWSCFFLFFFRKLLNLHASSSAVSFRLKCPNFRGNNSSFYPNRQVYWDDDKVVLGKEWCFDFLFCSTVRGNLCVCVCVF